MIYKLMNEYDFGKGWYVGRGGVTAGWQEPSEALAYTANAIVQHSAMKDFAAIEKATTCQLAKQSWDFAWTDMRNVYSTNIKWGGFFFGDDRPVTDKDIWDVNDKLQVRFSCSQLLPLYNKMLKDKGLNCCLECSPMLPLPFK